MEEDKLIGYYNREKNQYLCPECFNSLMYGLEDWEEEYESDWKGVKKDPLLNSCERCGKQIW